ncbi:MAG: UDP-N-acetylmuramate dehydrogenase [Phycisphaerales bacterium]|nr:UDP-N-acetylmuramate dehydrogenase [Phycisphaerales bacterium]
MRTMTAATPSLWNDLDLSAEMNAPLGALTWYRSGGRAEVLVHPNTVDALQSLCQRCHEMGIAMRVLGLGANLLVTESGVDGVVVRLSAPAFCGANWLIRADGETIRVGGGAQLMPLTAESARHGFEGLSALAGIPASIGGAIRMNAGGAFGDTAAIVHSIEHLSLAGERTTIAAAALDFGYRHCALPAGIVIAANLALTQGDPEKIRKHLKEVSAYKKNTQPMRDNSAGCMFKNPLDPTTGRRESAGKLIDLAGMKGIALGSAYVSPVHGNFIALKNGGCADDVLALATAVQLRVLEHSGIRLEREVIVWSKKGDVS